MGLRPCIKTYCILGLAFFTFSTCTAILAAPPMCAGDYNDDGICADAADYVPWRKFMGTHYELPNDFHPRPIGQNQYDEWRSHFVTFLPGSGGVSEASSTPEPTSAALMAISALAASTFSQRRRAKDKR
jgi:hypothetical protein